MGRCLRFKWTTVKYEKKRHQCFDQFTDLLLHKSQLKENSEKTGK